MTLSERASKRGLGKWELFEGKEGLSSQKEQQSNGGWQDSKCSGVCGVAVSHDGRSLGQVWASGPRGP